MSKYFTLFLTAFLLHVSLFAQSPEPTLGDSKLMFQDYYYLKEWKKALPHLLHVLEEAPDENEKYYIKGGALYTKLIKETSDPTEIKQHQQAVLDLYSQRMLIFGTNSKIQNQQLFLKEFQQENRKTHIED